MTLRSRRVAVVSAPRFRALPLCALAAASALWHARAEAQPPPPAPPPPATPDPTTAPGLAPAPLPPPPPPLPPVAAPVSQALPPPPPAKSSIVEFSSLRLMLEKGIISQAEYDAAVSDIAASTGYRAPDATSLVVGKWSTTVYGFAETDVINDSTGSFNDTAGNGLILRPNGVPPVAANEQNTYSANHGKTQMSIRNSRLGLQLRAPETHGVRVRGLVETDFEGYLPTPSASGGPTQSQFFTSPTMRLRHAMVQIETPYIDVLIGQYWDLFGWQNVYHPNTVQVQGIVGELYSRDPQIRLSHAFKTKAVEIEIAAMARRPPSADSQVPEGQGGVRFAFPWWTGVTTTGATGTSVMPASIALTADFRQFALPEFSQTPTRTVELSTNAFAADVFLPIVPQNKVDHGNAFSLTGEAVVGDGISDLYTGLTNGLTFPSVKPNLNLPETSTPLTYPQDIDNGMVVYDLAGNLHAIQITSLIVGAQYYLPGLKGHVWVSGNFAHTSSNNIADYTRPPTQAVVTTQAQYASGATVVSQENFGDANLFWDIISGARVGVEYANFNDKYVDGIHAVNNRFQFSGFFIF